LTAVLRASRCFSRFGPGLGALAATALALGWLAACDPGGDADPDPNPQDGGSDSPFGCPDPGDPKVHYKTTNVSECPIEELVCTGDQNGFHNSCGCGCIDKGNPSCNFPLDAGVNFISPDPARCAGIDPACPLGYKPFNNLCGCGCAPE
jgi:hypothetical protein